MKTILTTISFLLLSAGVFAQNNGDWKLVQSKNGINIYAKEAVCTIDFSGVQLKNNLLKIENTTGTVKNVSFRYGLYYGTTNCATCNNNEYDQKFTIAPNASIEASCDNLDDKLKVFIRYENEKNYNPDLSKMEFVNLIVN